MMASGCFHPASLDRVVSGAADVATTQGDVLADPAQVAHYERAEARVMLRPALLARILRVLRRELYGGAAGAGPRSAA